MIDVKSLADDLYCAIRRKEEVMVLEIFQKAMILNELQILDDENYRLIILWVKEFIESINSFESIAENIKECFDLRKM